MGWRVLLLAVSCALVGFAPAPFPRAERRRAESLADFEGTWAILHWEMAGRRHWVYEKHLRARLTRRSVELLNEDDEAAMRYVMRLEPDRSPPAVTWGDPGRPLYAGSYRQQGDQLVIVFNRGRDLADRPTEFAGACFFRVVLRRTRR
jgi:uncharacterized protein (TIGR03067 family)